MAEYPKTVEVDGVIWAVDTEKVANNNPSDDAIHALVLRSELGEFRFSPSHTPGELKNALREHTAPPAVEEGNDEW